MDLGRLDIDRPAEIVDKVAREDDPELIGRRARRSLYRDRDRPIVLLEPWLRVRVQCVIAYRALDTVLVGEDTRRLQGRAYASPIDFEVDIDRSACRHCPRRRPGIDILDRRHAVRYGNAERSGADRREGEAQRAERTPKIRELYI